MLLFVMQFPSRLLLRNSAHYSNADQQPLTCYMMFIGDDINIVTDKCSNRLDMC